MTGTYYNYYYAFIENPIIRITFFTKICISIFVFFMLILAVLNIYSGDLYPMPNIWNIKLYMTVVPMWLIPYILFILCGHYIINVNAFMWQQIIIGDSFIIIKRNKKDIKFHNNIVKWKKTWLPFNGKGFVLINSSGEKAVVYSLLLSLDEVNNINNYNDLKKMLSNKYEWLYSIIIDNLA